jgi:hypothetical protein
MPLKKFGDNDIFHNTVRTAPKNQFDVYGGEVYFQNVSEISGAFTDSVPNIPTGFKSLYEINVDRNESQTGLIYPFVTKDGTLASFSTISTTTFNSNFAYGDIITGSYPLSASVSRNYIIGSIGRNKINALKTSINNYPYWSPHYQFSSSYGNRATQTINLISIPSIFYGSSIDKENGTISLKYYVSGTLIGELQDINRNGELIQVGPSGSVGSGSVAGIALYNEGFLLLTGSWDLEGAGVTRNYLEDPTSLMPSSWLFYGVGMNDASGTAIPYVNYRMDFEGVNYIETLTMLAHAEKAELNHSNNPTYIEYDGSTSSLEQFDFNSAVFSETKRAIKNTVKSPYPDPSGSFEKTTYITKVGIYDEDRNLIGVATVSKPVKKTLDRDLTFKLKLDLQ